MAKFEAPSFDGKARNYKSSKAKFEEMVAADYESQAQLLGKGSDGGGQTKAIYCYENALPRLDSIRNSLRGSPYHREGSHGVVAQSDSQ